MNSLRLMHTIDNVCEMEANHEVPRTQAKDDSKIIDTQLFDMMVIYDVPPKQSECYKNRDH